jgi:hypothetical protein
MAQHPYAPLPLAGMNGFEQEVGYQGTSHEEGDEDEDDSGIGRPHFLDILWTRTAN